MLSKQVLNVVKINKNNRTIFRILENAQRDRKYVLIKNFLDKVK